MTLCYLEPDQGKPWFVENGQLLTRIVEIVGFNPSGSIMVSLDRKACQVENRKGNNHPDGWKPKGPGYERQLPVSGVRWITVLEAPWIDEWGGGCEVRGRKSGRADQM